jgi:hypothetical protein
MSQYGLMIVRRAKPENSWNSDAMSDSERPKPPTLDYDTIEARLDPAQRAELAGLRAQIERENPDRERIRGHVSALRETEARVANWFDSPETQRWMLTITETGL